MNFRKLMWSACVLMLLVSPGTRMRAQVVSPNSPGIFQYYVAPPSADLGFLASDAGGQYLLHSPSPAAKQWLMRFHPDLVSLWPQKPLWKSTRLATAPAATLSGCGTASGTRMNLEPAANAVIQKQPSVDFILSGLAVGADLVVEHGTDFRGITAVFPAGLTAAYLHRDATQPCYGGTDFEMGNPAIASPFLSTDMVPSTGNARVLADPVRSQMILADSRMDASMSGIGLRRIPTTTLKNTTTCAAGTQTALQTATCLAGTPAVIVDPSIDDLADASSIAQDPRATGTGGAGDIYIANTSFGGLPGSVIHLTACKGNFASKADCSPPIIASGLQNHAQFPSAAVVQGGTNVGKILITYLNGTSAIQSVLCTPHGAPVAPTCAGPVLVASESNALFFFAPLIDNPNFSFNFRPSLAVRTDASGTTAFVVWARCKATFFFGACPDADVVMKTSTSLGTTWSGMVSVNAGAGLQFMPAIAYDSGQNIINIAYYSTAGPSSSDLYKNRVIVVLNQILGGTTTVGAATPLTTVFDSTAGDVHSTFSGGFGDYIGLAAHGGSAAGSSRVYAGFTNNSRVGSYTGLIPPSTIVTTANTEANNHVARATY